MTPPFELLVLSRSDRYGPVAASMSSTDSSIMHRELVVHTRCPQVGSHAEPRMVETLSLRTGVHRAHGLGPKIATIGKSVIAARCIGPLSLQINIYARIKKRQAEQGSVSDTAPPAGFASGSGSCS